MAERDGHVTGRVPERAASLVCRVATRICAVPLGAVSETMRPLPARPIALDVDAVLGVRRLAAEQLPALAGAVAGDVIAAVGALDARLVVVLEASRLVPPAVFELVERAAS